MNLIGALQMSACKLEVGQALASQADFMTGGIGYASAFGLWDPPIFHRSRPSWFHKLSVSARPSA